MYYGVGLKVGSELSSRDEKSIDQLFEPLISSLYIMKGFTDNVNQPLDLAFFLDEYEFIVVAETTKKRYNS